MICWTKSWSTQLADQVQAHNMISPIKPVSRAEDGWFQSRVFSESISHDSIFYCSASLCLGFRLTFKRYIFIYNSSHTNCFPGKVFSYIPLLPWNTERAWKYLCLFGKEIAPPTPHLKVFPLPRREEGHKVLWLIPSLSYQPRSGEQEREKETTRGCKENPCKLGSHKRH